MHFGVIAALELDFLRRNVKMLIDRVLARCDSFLFCFCFCVFALFLIGEVLNWCMYMCMSVYCFCGSFT